MTARAAPSASAAAAMSTSSITAATSSGEAAASRCAGASSNVTRNCLRVWSIPRSGVTEIPGESVCTAKSPVPLGVLGERQQDVGGGGVGHRGDLAPQHDVAALRSAATEAVSTIQEADGGDRGAVGDPAQKLGRDIVGAEPGQGARRRRPRSTTTAPGAARRPALRRRCRPRPSSCRPRRTPPVPAGRLFRDRQDRATRRRSVPVGSSSSGRTWPEIGAFSARKRRVVSRSAACSSVSSRFICAAARVPAAR